MTQAKTNGARRPAAKATAPKTKTQEQRITELEDQVLKLRKAFAAMMLQNPQVQEALAARLVEQGEI